MTSLTPEQWRHVSPYLDEALEMAPEELPSWLRSLHEQDAVLASMLQALLDEHEQLNKEGFLQSSPLRFSSGLAGQNIGAYTLVSQIGQGGMGSVWLARRSDGRFDRQAAVKFISIALAGIAAEQRFKREGSILGRLTHPHIAELLDAGVSPGGQPYLVLEYVDGAAIDQYCDERRLDVDTRIRLFLDVLSAVAHAHAHLIVHRDIKPSNVLVTSEGKVKLLDFGIAKLLEGEGQTGAPTLLTHEGGSAMTPEYAAPEQLSNQPVTTATDLYSLGVLFYLLLTGRHPAGHGTRSPAELIKAVIEHEPPRAPDAVAGDSVAAANRGTTSEKLRRRLRGDLDTILAKMLKKDPGERYSSVTVLADDLSRYLNQQPISARPDSFWYRARKFVRRNRVSVLLGTSALVLVITSLSAGLYVANHERKIAEQRFAQVRQLANKFIDLDNKIRGLSGSTEVRMQMVSDSLQYLTSLGSQAHIDKDLALEIAYAYVRVAHAQGDPTSPNLGQFAEAEVSLNKAAGFVDPILAKDPRNRRALYIAATVSHDRMALDDSNGLKEKELKDAATAAMFIDRFLSLGGASPGDTYSMAYFYTNVGAAHYHSRQFDETVRYCQRALDISDSIRKTGWLRGGILSILAGARWQSGNLNDALKTAVEAVDLEDKKSGGHISLRINLANGLDLEGMILGKEDAEPSLGRTRDALVAFEKAKDIAEELAEKDPNDYLGRHNVATASLEIGNILRHTDAGKALAIYDHALARIAEAKSNESTKRDAAELLAASSYAARWAGRKDDARQRIDRALHLLHDAGRYPADKIEPMSDTYDALRAQADDYAETGQVPKAVGAYQQLLDKMMAWKADPVNDLRDATCISRTWTALAGLLRRAGRRDEAEQLEAQRTELWNRWNGKLPNAQFLLRQSLTQIRPPQSAHSGQHQELLTRARASPLG